MFQLKKVLQKFSLLTLVSTSVLQTAAFTFNPHEESVMTQNAKIVAEESASVIKALLLSEKISLETQTIITDIFAILNLKTPTSIANNLVNHELNNWEDFKQYWGSLAHIETDFNFPAYIIGENQGEITAEIKNRAQADKLLTLANNLRTITNINNQILYNLAISQGSPFAATILGILNDINTIIQANKALPPEERTLVANCLLNYPETIFKPLAAFFYTALVASWNITTNDVISPETSPTTYSELQAILNLWKDNQGHYMSAFNTAGQFDNSSVKAKKWTEKEWTYYRSSVLLNHLTYQIDLDLNRAEPRYFGDIINQYFKSAIDFTNTTLRTEFIADLSTNYWPYLKNNTTYWIKIAEIMLPLLKETFSLINPALPITAITLGSETKAASELNLQQTWNQIYDVLNNADAMKNLVEKLITSPITYDIKATISGFFSNYVSIGEFLNSTLGTVALAFIKEIISEQIDKLFQNPQYDQILKEIDVVNTIIPAWNNLFTANPVTIPTGHLYALLFALQNSLFAKLVPFFTTINNFPSGAITYDELAAAYTSLGGNIPDAEGTLSPNYQPDSFIQTVINDITISPIDRVLEILIGDSAKQQKGLTDLIIMNNETFIYDKYRKYLPKRRDDFDLIVSNYKMTIPDVPDNLEYDQLITVDYDVQITLEYDVYNFHVSLENKCLREQFNGIRKFYFKAINKL